MGTGFSDVPVLCCKGVLDAVEGNDLLEEIELRVAICCVGKVSKSRVATDS